MKMITAALLALALAACSGGPMDAGLALDETAARAQCVQPAPLSGTPHPRTVGSYIVVFAEGTGAAAVTARLAQTHGFQPRHVYEHALQGFSAALTDAQLAGVRCEPEVRYVAHDGFVTVG